MPRALGPSRAPGGPHPDGDDGVDLLREDHVARGHRQLPRPGHLRQWRGQGGRQTERILDEALMQRAGERRTVDNAEI